MEANGRKSVRSAMEPGYLDAILSGLLISSLIYLTIRSLSFYGLFSIRDVVHGRSSIRGEEERLRSAVAAFARFKDIAQLDVQRMQKSYAKLGRLHKRIGYGIGYPSKLKRLSNANKANSVVADRIARLAMSQHKLDIAFTNINSKDLSKVRETFKHYVRDWSADGAKERGVIFGPILASLAETLHASEDLNAKELDVLVPGSGLGRLAWEIHEMGACSNAHEPFTQLNSNFRRFSYNDR